MEKRCYGCMRLKTQSPLCEHCGYNENIDNLPHQLPLGTILHGQYEVGKVLGQGGFGITYLGWDRALESPVAIKEYYPSAIGSRETLSSLTVSCTSEQGLDSFRHNQKRFLKEARVLAKLSGIPGIVRVLNLFEENETAYIVMEYVQGMDLRRYVQLMGGKLTPEQTFAILKPVMQVLEKVHEADLVHRDISPDNIMLQPDGTAKLLDFGAVREVVDADTEKMLSQSTEAILKHGFAPLEQYQKKGSLGPWTDVYAMCATIYYCLTGAVPPEAHARLLDGEQIPWDTVPGLTQAQREDLAQGMQLLPRERTASMAALSRVLYGTVTEPETELAAPVQQPRSESVKVEPTPDVIHEETTSPEPEETKGPEIGTVRRKKTPLLIAAVLAVLAIIAGVAMGMGGEKPAPEKPAGETAAAEEKQYVLMAQPLSVFSDIEKRAILTVTFLNTGDAPEHSVDVSAEGSDVIYAWLTKNGSGYDLFFAAEGIIRSGSSCAEMFSGCTGLQRVYFNRRFDTEQATDLHRMFAGCQALESFSFGDLNTANVTDVSGMFHGCGNVKLAGLSSLDTAKITNYDKFLPEGRKVNDRPWEELFR